MAEEFQESDIIFHDHDLSFFDFQEFNNHRVPTGHDNSLLLCNNSKKSKKKKSNNKKLNSTSLPVSIPNHVFHMGDTEDPFGFEDEYDGDELVPPHVIVGRRVVGKMAFSVCTGNGRTLKGRDLSQVRNSILRMTGFLES